MLGDRLQGVRASVPTLTPCRALRSLYTAEERVGDRRELAGLVRVHLE